VITAAITALNVGPVHTRHTFVRSIFSGARW